MTFSHLDLNGIVFSLQAFVSTGTNLFLNFLANAWSERTEDRVPTREFVDFDREAGKVSSVLLSSAVWL